MLKVVYEEGIRLHLSSQTFTGGWHAGMSCGIRKRHARTIQDRQIGITHFLICVRRVFGLNSPASLDCHLLKSYLQIHETFLKDGDSSTRWISSTPSSRVWAHMRIQLHYLAIQYFLACISCGDYVRGKCMYVKFHRIH